MKFINKFLIVAVLLASSACKSDWLDLQDPNVLTADTFFQTEEDFELSLTTMYPVFNGVWGSGGFAANLRSDGIRVTTTDFVEPFQYHAFVNSAEGDLGEEFWGGAYTLIFRANTILKQLETADFLDQETRDLIEAETRFFRGAAYFRLAHGFGRVPIVLEPAESPEEFDNAPAETFEEVWDQAIADMLAGKNGLPEESPAQGRVNKFVATAWLGMCYLYRAGYLQDNSFYAPAAVEFKEIIDSEVYALEEEWVNNILQPNTNNGESIYEIQYGLFPGVYSATQERAFVGSVPGIAGEIVFAPASFLFEEMSLERTVDDQLDTRMLNTLFFQGGYLLFGQKFSELEELLECQDGGSFTLDGDPLPEEFEGWFRKYLNVHQSCEDPETNVNNDRIMRYSDVLLMYAEALTMSNGDLNEAANAVNQIRTRVNLSEMTFANTQELMAEIEHQRILEFAFEGKRYYDLIRWGVLKERLTENGQEFAGNIEEKHNYHPYPQDEVLQNSLLDQNPLWQ